VRHDAKERLVVIRNSPEAWSERAQEELSHDAAMWSELGQRERFAAVLKALRPQPGDSLLDFGCGTGLFSTWIPDGVGYLGYDWAPGMIRRAQRDHPKEAFVNELPVIDVDLVACIGCFNLQDGWSKQQTWDTLTDLWSRCRHALSVCLYAGEDDEDEDCISYLDSDCITFCKSLPSAYWNIERHRSNDFLVTLRRREVIPR
jgi:SAM-dependent methyltransferase